MVVTEAEVAALAQVERRMIMEAPQVNNLAEAPNGRSSNPYAMGYMGAANGSTRTSSLWKRNRVTPIPGN
jgi:hypothetical protein